MMPLRKGMVKVVRLRNP